MLPAQQSLQADTLLSFSREWQILGPFQIGTREATWGADPLESLGGFRSLEYNETQSFHSSLANNGTVTWTTQIADSVDNSPSCTQINLNINFTNVFWTFLQSIYGWAALQWQAWARGNLRVTGGDPRTITLYTDNVLEFWVDGTPHFGGDMYAYRRAPLVLQLGPGDHRIDIRIIRDLRAMGSSGANVEVKLEAVESQRHDGGLVIDERSLLIPDMIWRPGLASPFGSLTVRNEGTGWIKIKEIRSIDVSNK